jgi:hypothetical protein
VAFCKVMSQNCTVALRLWEQVVVAYCKVISQNCIVAIRLWEQVVVAYYKIISQNLHSDTKGQNEKLHSV